MPTDSTVSKAYLGRGEKSDGPMADRLKGGVQAET